MAAAGGRGGEATRLVDAARDDARGARLLLEAGLLRQAARLHADATAALEAAFARLPQADEQKARLRSVTLPPAAPTGRPDPDELAAAFDGFRALLRDAEARCTAPPPPSPGPREAPRERPAASRPAPTKPAPGKPPPVKPAPATPPPLMPSPAAPPHDTHRPVSSAVFWSLADRWRLDDLEALRLLGHEGGLTKKGTRPRFRLTEAEAARLAELQGIDDALAALGTAPAPWLRAKLRAPPFAGAAPLDRLLGGGEAARREVARHVVSQGLRRSLKGGAGG